MDHNFYDDNVSDVSFDSGFSSQGEGKKVIKMIVKKNNIFKEEFFIPEQCKGCSIAKEQGFEDKILGVRIQTPFSYLLLEGCTKETVCDKKCVQLMYYGLSINTYVVERFWIELWQVMNGKVEIGDRAGFIDEFKKRVGFIKSGNQEGKEITIVIPEIVDMLVQFLKEKKISCSFECPVVGHRMIVARKKRGSETEYETEFIPIEELLGISSKELFKIKLGYFTPVAYTTYDVVLCFTEEEPCNYGNAHRSNVYIDSSEEEQLMILLNFELKLNDLVKQVVCNPQEGMKILERIDEVFKKQVMLASLRK